MLQINLTVAVSSRANLTICICAVIDINHVYDIRSVVVRLGSFEYLCVDSVLVSSTAEGAMATELVPCGYR